MQEKELKASLPKIMQDDMFTTQKERDRKDLPELKIIQIKELHTFPNHPFKVIDNEEMQGLAESILSEGIVEPLIVRPRKEGGYQILAGHRRKRACQIAGIQETLCIVKNYNDNQATIAMVDSNNHRDGLLPSEKAFSFKMKLEAIKKQGKRNDLITSAPMAGKLQKKETAAIVGEEFGESGDNIRRYIRLTELIPDLLQLVDDKKIAFRPAVEISYLTKEEQDILLDCIQFMDVTPSLSQAIRLKKLSQSANLDSSTIDEILCEEKPNQIEKIKINKSKLESVLPKSLKSQNDIENFIIQCVQDYTKRQKQKNIEGR